MSDLMRVVGPMERTLFFKSVSVTGDLRPREIAVLAEYARERHCKKGEALLRRGEPTSAFYVVVEGCIRVSGAEYPDGHEAGPEDSIGMLSLLSRSNEGIDAVAEVDSLVLEIDEDVLFDLLEEHFYFVHGVIRRLAHATLEERKQIPDGEFLGERTSVIECPDRPLDFVERILMVRRGRVFVNSSLDSLATLARSLREERYEAGTPIWRLGDPSGFTLLVVSGVVECRQADGRGTFRCGAGYPLGNAESLAGERRWYDATTETPFVGLRGDTEIFLDVLEDDFQMASDFLQAFATGLIRILSER